MLRRLIVLVAIVVTVDFAVAADDLPAVDLFYVIDSTETKDPQPPLEELVKQVTQRVEPWGRAEAREDGIRIRVDAVKHVSAVERALPGGGGFELRILANTRDHAEIIAKARESKEALVRGEHSKVLARWIAVDRKLAADRSKISDWTTRIGDFDDVEALVVEDRYRITGEFLENARVGRDRRGQPIVIFGLTAHGGDRIFNLTAENLPDLVTGFRRQLAVIVRGYIVAAPPVNTAINREGELADEFTSDQAEAIAVAMRAGMKRLPLKLDRWSAAQPPVVEKQQP